MVERFLVTPSGDRRNDRTQLIGEDDLQDTSSPPQQGAGGYGTVSVPLGEEVDGNQLLKTPDSVATAHSNLFLYHDEFKERPAMAGAINSIANYSPPSPWPPETLMQNQLKRLTLGP